MNTIRSVWIGWGSLCIAGGTAYYFAKRSINADRAERQQAQLKRQRDSNAYEYSYNSSTAASSAEAGAAAGRQQKKKAGGAPPPAGNGGMDPSSEATSGEPAPTRHPPHSGGEGGAREKSKYEASVPYRSRKGDRFS